VTVSFAYIFECKPKRVSDKYIYTPIYIIASGGYIYIYRALAEGPKGHAKLPFLLASPIPSIAMPIGTSAAAHFARPIDHIRLLVRGSSCAHRHVHRLSDVAQLRTCTPALYESAHTHIYHPHACSRNSMTKCNVRASLRAHTCPWLLRANSRPRDLRQFAALEQVAGRPGARRFVAVAQAPPISMDLVTPELHQRQAFASWSQPLRTRFHAQYYISSLHM
jgi:hypothetical protein